MSEHTEYMHINLAFPQHVMYIFNVVRKDTYFTLYNSDLCSGRHVGSIDRADMLLVLESLDGPNLSYCNYLTPFRSFCVLNY